METNKTREELIQKSIDTMTDIRCLSSGKCQETEGFKGTIHEGLDMCEDGCVWFHVNRRNPNNKE